MCPIKEDVVALGQTGIQLNRPMRVTWQSGKVGRHEYRTEPDPLAARRLKTLTGRVLGPGCVVADHYDPDRERSAYWEAAARLRLVDAEDPGDPDTWIVNQPLVYRACAACKSHIPDLPAHRVPAEWTPARAFATKGCSQYSRCTVPVDQGAHPADSLACPDCRPGGPS